MSNQDVRNQIDKAAWSLVEGVRDVVSVNVTIAARTDLKIEPDTLAKLMMIMKASIEEGYNRGSRVFSKTVEEALGKAERVAEARKELWDDVKVTGSKKKHA
jgi:hypothetical protein